MGRGITNIFKAENQGHLRHNGANHICLLLFFLTILGMTEMGEKVKRNPSGQGDIRASVASTY